jgi:hypothetical protein
MPWELNLIARWSVPSEIPTSGSFGLMLGCISTTRRLSSLGLLLAWRIFWLAMMHRSDRRRTPGLALTPVEIHLLDQLVKDKP